MKLIFIVGNSRSGTTMLGRILGNHAQVFTFGEIHFFEHLIDSETITKKSAWPEERCLTLLERLLTTARDGFFTKVEPGKYRGDAVRIFSDAKGYDPVSIYYAFLLAESAKHGKTIPCEQTPRYLFFVQEILEAFPEAVVINVVRDPRDVLLSQKNKWRRRFLGARNIPITEAVRAWANYHPYTIARLWVSAVGAASRYLEHPRFISVRYEDLLSEPEKTVRALCVLAGLDYSVKLLEVPQVGSSSGMDKPDKRGIDASRTGGWRKGGLTSTELTICERVCGEEMRRMGYESENISTATWRYWLSMGGFIVKVTLALALNLRRTRNLRETLRRRLGKQA